MIREDCINEGYSDSPKRVFHDHQKLKDAIWEDYSEDLKAAQENDAILPSLASRRSGSQISPSSRLGTDKEEEGADTNSPNKKSAIKIDTNLTIDMERNNNRRPISPQLDEFLEIVAKMGSDQPGIMFPPIENTQTAEMRNDSDMNTSTTNNGEIFNFQDHAYNDEIKMDNYQANMHNLIKTNDERRNEPKRRRIPPIEEIFNVTTFANQRSDYYKRLKTHSHGDEALYGTDMFLQHFGDQQLSKPQNCETPSNGRQFYPYSSTEISQQPGTSGSFYSSHERSIHEVQGPHSYLVSRPPPNYNSRSFPKDNMKTPSTTSLQGQLQHDIPPQIGSSRINELGIPNFDEISPSVDNLKKNIDNLINQMNNIPSAESYCLPVANGFASPQMENDYSHKATPTHSYPYHPPNSRHKAKDIDFPKNLNHPSFNPTVSPPNTSSKLNNTQHVSNFDTQELGLNSISQRPTYATSQVHSSYIDRRGNKILAIPSNLERNINIPPVETSQQTSFADKQDLKFSAPSSSIPARQESIQQPIAEAVPTPAPTGPQDFNHGPNHPNSVKWQRFPLKNQSPLNGPFANTSPAYHHLQGFPAPVDSTSVSNTGKEFSSVRPPHYPSFDNRDLSPITGSQQFNPTFDQKHPPTTRIQELPSTSNQQFLSQKVPRSNYEYPPINNQFTGPRPQQFHQTISRPKPSTSAAGIDMLDSTRINQWFPQHGANVENNANNLKAPRKRRVTKKITAAQAKRMQKYRKEIEGKLMEFLWEPYCATQHTSSIIKGRLFHMQNCTNWLVNDDCHECSTICDMVAHLSECQKYRNEIAGKLMEFLSKQHCDEHTSFINGRLFHLRNCTNWLVNDECQECSTIFEMVAHSSECQNLNCPNLFCNFNVKASVAECFSQPDFVSAFLRQLNVSEDEINDLFHQK